MVKKGCALSSALLLVVAQVQFAEAKLDCGPTTNKSIQLPRTIGSAPIPPAPAPMRSLRRLRPSPARRPRCRQRFSLPMVPTPGCPYWRAAGWISAFDILDSNMAATGTGELKKPFSEYRVVAGGVFPVHSRP